MSIDPKKFGLSDSLVNAVNEALKGGQKKLDKNHNGKIDGQDFKMLRKEEVVDEGNPANKAKKNAAVAAVGAKNRDGQYLSRMNPAVADKIRGREKMSGKDRQQFEEVEQVDEAGMSRREAGAHWDANKKSEKKSDTLADYKNKTAYQKAALAAKKKVSEGVEQVDELSKATLGSYVTKASDKAATHTGAAAHYGSGGTGNNPAKMAAHQNIATKRKMGIQKAVDKLTKEETVVEAAPAASGVADQMAARKDALQSQIQRKIAQKQMDVMKSKANKRISNIKETDSKCSCGTTNESKMKCEVHGGKDKATKGGREAIVMNPPLKEASNLPKKVVTKGHEIAKSLIKHKSKVDNPYAVGMAAAKKSAKMKAYRADRDKHGED